MSKAFTIIELMVTILVIAVLIGITLPAISSVRNRAKYAVSISNLRTHAQAITAYTTDNSDGFPYFTVPGELVEIDNPPFPVGRLQYFDMHRAWHLGLARDYYALNHTAEIFRSPRTREPGELDIVFADYFYPCAFIASPQYWTAEGRREGPSQLVATSANQVRYPSAKAVMVESRPYLDEVRVPADVLRTSLPMSFVDGSAAALGVQSRIYGYERGDGYINAQYGAVHYTNFLDGLHTVGGVEGRDRK